MARSGGIDAEGAEFKPLVLGVSAQVPDLRSQVVRSACAVLVELAVAVGDHSAFDRPSREVVLPALIDLAGNGNKVVPAVAAAKHAAIAVHSRSRSGNIHSVTARTIVVRLRHLATSS